jgi:hypothetical protein
VQIVQHVADMVPHRMGHHIGVALGDRLQEIGVEGIVHRIELAVERLQRIVRLLIGRERRGIGGRRLGSTGGKTRQHHGG